MVAQDFFRPPRGTFLEIQERHRHHRPHEGADFIHYEALQGTRSLGSFTRMRLHTDASTRVDLALRLANGRLVDARALRPVILDGTPLLDLPALLLELSNEGLTPVAPGLAAIFEALSHLDRFDPSGSEHGITTTQATTLAKLIEGTRSPLATSARLPAFSRPDLAGGAVTRDDLAALGKPIVLFLGSLTTDLDRRVLGWLQERQPEKAAEEVLVTVLFDSDTVIDRYRLRGGRLEGRVLRDRDLVLHDALGATFTPAVLRFDAKLELERSLRPPFPSIDDLERRLAGDDRAR